MFTNIVARWPGSTHDSFVFSSSLIGQRFESQPRTLEDGLLLGDSGYPCKPYLMTPYLNPTSVNEEAFNQAHKATRVAIEQTFGWWKRRLHLLHSEVRMKPEKVCLIIGACTILHNIAILRSEPQDCHLLHEDDQPAMAPFHGSENGRAVRDHICHTFFPNSLFSTRGISYGVSI